MSGIFLTATDQAMEFKEKSMPRLLALCQNMAVLALLSLAWVLVVFQGGVLQLVRFLTRALLRAIVFLRPELRKDHLLL